jgi:hypothetical protein
VDHSLPGPQIPVSGHFGLTSDKVALTFGVSCGGGDGTGSVFTGSDSIIGSTGPKSEMMPAGIATLDGFEVSAAALVTVAVLVSTGGDVKSNAGVFGSISGTGTLDE